jgi:hypothetical protein
MDMRVVSLAIIAMIALSVPAVAQEAPARHAFASQVIVATSSRNDARGSSLQLDLPINSGLRANAPDIYAINRRTGVQKQNQISATAGSPTHDNTSSPPSSFQY